MKILWIAPRWPEPANDGAKIATLELVKYLQAPKNTQDDLQVTFLAISPDDEETPPLPGVRLHETLVLKRKKPTSSPLLRLLRNPLLPVTFASFMEEGLQRVAHGIAMGTRWDRVVFDGMHAAIPFFRKSRLLPGFSFPDPGTQLIYRAHNVEFSLWERAARASGTPKKQALQLQARLVKNFEESLLRQADLVLPVSEEDASLFCRLVPKTQAKVIRIGQDFPQEPPRRGPGPAADSITLGFIGRLDWMPNRQGLDWFLSEVWPQASRSNPRLQLKIAGSGDGKWLERHEKLAGIRFLGKIPSVESFYSHVDAAIVPLFVGSGTRVKVIEASRFAVPCISTRLGVEGCPLRPGDSYILAESAQDWMGTLAELSADRLRKTGSAAFSMMKTAYDAATIAEQLKDSLRGSPRSNIIGEL